MNILISLLIVAGIPLLFTILNIRGLIKKYGPAALAWEIPALLIGWAYSWMLYGTLSDYPESIDRVNEMVKFHAPLASWHFPTLFTVFILSIVSFVLLRASKALPPIPTALGLSSMLAACLSSAACVIQLSGNITSDFHDSFPIILSLLYPLNIILLYARVIRQKADELAVKINAHPPRYSNPALNACAKLLLTASGWVFVSFLLMFPLFCVLTIILVLFGQRPDAIIKVFTDTSEWSLSQQVSPPDLEHSGHYLCTVAARGHPRLVRPTRHGRRHGRRIVVNRQLCVANAFEQVIAEKLPYLHGKMRCLYDTCGYPISRHITTKYRADFAYLLMKPVEFVFILFLYSVEANPENRIAAQYLPLF
jgi:hypothetical protein